MAYTTIDNPGLFFNTVLYTGNGGTQSITGVGFKPDWIWQKERSSTSYHVLTDAVRGNTKQLFSNDPYQDATSSNYITSFDSDGFGQGTNNDTNQNSETYVAWNWKAGESASSNSDGSITSSVSANTTAGFSIVSYTGTGSNATVGHGLGAVAKCIIFKDRVASSDWRMYHVGVGNTAALTLNNSNAKQTNSVFFQDTTPTSTVFSLGTGTDVNNTNAFIAYCFTDVKGYSKFGSYTGNGNADGPFVYTGFKPAFIMLKKTSDTANWMIHDTKRIGYNVDNNNLKPNTAEVEATADTLDILSNGFKLRTSGSGENNGDFIYMAFAEAPFVTAGTKAAGTAR